MYRAYDTQERVAPANRRILSHFFDSLGEFLDAQLLPPDPCQPSGMRNSLDCKAEGDAWTYGELKDGATYDKTLREGWSDAIPRIDALAASLQSSMATPLDLRRKIRKGPSGDDYDIHTARAGKLDRAWTARRKTIARAPAPIRIIAGVVFNAGVDSEAFFWRGACALALASALRRKGYRIAISGVGVFLGFDSATCNLTYCARIDALRYGEAIDTARLASILCTSATLRHALFRTVQLLPVKVAWGYGHAPYGNEMEHTIVCSGAFPVRNEERIAIPTHIGDRPGAEEWLKVTSGRFA